MERRSTKSEKSERWGFSFQSWWSFWCSMLPEVFLTIQQLSTLESFPSVCGVEEFWVAILQVQLVQNAWALNKVAKCSLSDGLKLNINMIPMYLLNSVSKNRLLHLVWRGHSEPQNWGFHYTVSLGSLWHIWHWAKTAMIWILSTSCSYYQFSRIWNAMSVASALSLIIVKTFTIPHREFPWNVQFVYDT